MYQKFSMTLLAAAFAMTTLTVTAAPREVIYTDIVQYVMDQRNYEEFDRITARMIEDFDYICGDTFCEGEYVNLTPIEFTCSVKSATGEIKSCAWLFAGSHTSIDETTGVLTHDKKIFECKIVIPGTVDEFMKTMNAAMNLPGHSYHTLRADLAHGGTPIYDQLVECF